MKQKPTIHTWLWMLLLCIPLAFASCENDVHKNEAGGLSVALAWQDATDETAIKDIRLWIFNAADGSLAEEQHYTDTRALASQRYRLNAGQYKVVAAINLTSPFSANSGASMNDLLLSLSEASASPEHAFCGVADATVSSDNAVTVVTDSLSRILAELTVTINNAPAAAVMTGSVNNAATGFYPIKTQTDKAAQTATLPKTTAQGSTIQMQTMRLMPTTSGQNNTEISLQITNADGHVSEFGIEAPAMKAGGKYEITLDYHAMRAYMNLSVYAINSWAEDWSYNGELLNPDK